MFNPKVEKAMNDQINAEMFSSYLYLSMSSWFSEQNYDGFATWMKAQAGEEYGHAMKIYDYVISRGGKVTLQTIEGPKIEWESVVNVFEETLEHEKKVTSLINDLMNLAIGEKDHASVSFLQWFVNEQVEEEDSASSILEKIKLVADNKAGLFMMDRDLGQRPA